MNIKRESLIDLEAQKENKKKRQIFKLANTAITMIRYKSLKKKQIIEKIRFIKEDLLTECDKMTL